MAETRHSSVQRLVLAGLAAGVWVLASGLLMAVSFGYHDMQVAFDAIGLPVANGPQAAAVHTTVRLLMGMAVVALYALMLHVWVPGKAMLGAAAFTWLLAVVLPFAVVVQWGLFGWALAAKLWAWSAGELLIAALIGRSLYRSAAA